MKDAFKVGNLVWRGWDLFRDYSGHLMTNWGAHSIDMIQYALGKDATGPVTIVPSNRNDIDWVAGLDDQWLDKTPPLRTVRDPRLDWQRFQPLTMRYSDGIEIRFLPEAQATTFYGEKGKLFLSRNRYYTDPPGLLPETPAEELAKWEGSGHVARPRRAGFELPS